MGSLIDFNFWKVINSGNIHIKECKLISLPGQKKCIVDDDNMNLILSYNNICALDNRV